MEKFLKTLADKLGRWLEVTTAESDIIVSTRIRLARNVTGFPFVSKLQNEKAAELEGFLKTHIFQSAMAPELSYFPLTEVSGIGRQIFLERHLISRELANSKLPRGVAFNSQETVSIMVNEEDHLRLQVIGAGFQLDSLWNEMRRVDRCLEAKLDYAYSNDFGYLTACPTNVGTGMRVSIMVHLPALAMTEKELKRVFNAASKTNLAVRGLHGEGTKGIGDFYQISNQITLGRNEDQILEDLRQITPQIIEFERKVRATLFEEKRHALEDRIHRSFALLQSARSMSSDEAISYLSLVRLGIHLGVLDKISSPTIQKLLIQSQPGHLQARLGKEVKAETRDIERAKLLRAALS